MKRAFLKKLGSQRGESIIETLISVLIAALALAMLAGAIGAANSVIRKSDQTMDQYYSNMVKMGKPDEGDMTVQISGVKMDEEKGEISVVYQQNTAFPGRPIVAYRVGTKGAGT